MAIIVPSDTKADSARARYGVPVLLEGKVQFPDFSMRYLGNTTEQHPLVSIVTFTDAFEVVGLNNLRVRVEVTAGQLPPEPTAFYVNNEGFTLYTFRQPDGKRMDTGNVVVVQGALKADESPTDREGITYIEPPH